MERRRAKIIAFWSLILFLIMICVIRVLMDHAIDAPIAAYILVFFGIMFACSVAYLVHTMPFWENWSASLLRDIHTKRRQDRDD